MIHFVLHDARDTVAVVVVEGVKSGMALTGWIMDEDRTMNLQAQQDIPIGHKVALKDMQPGDTVLIADAGAYGLAATLTVRVPGVERKQAVALVERAHEVCPYSVGTRGNMEVQLFLEEETGHRTDIADHK